MPLTRVSSASGTERDVGLYLLIPVSYEVGHGGIGVRDKTAQLGHDRGVLHGVNHIDASLPWDGVLLEVRVDLVVGATCFLDAVVFAREQRLVHVVRTAELLGLVAVELGRTHRRHLELDEHGFLGQRLDLDLGCLGMW